MTLSKIRISILLVIITCACVRDFTPLVNDYDETMVIEALITDQPVANYVKVSISHPLWKKILPVPLRYFTITITDDLGGIYTLKETSTYGIYATDPLKFRGVPGREYVLRVKTTKDFGNYTYESYPVKLIPVPQVDTMYYVKKAIENTYPPSQGCDVFLDTHDPTGICRFYRWEYVETWEFHIPYNIKNQVCWISENSKGIAIKNSDKLEGNHIFRQPVISINNPVDRLLVKYSILVKQYSLDEKEYIYWERLKNSVDQTGGIYDIIPATVPNNLFCVEDSLKKVLGYFSVSAVSEKRLFIKDKFAGINFMYKGCINDTIYTNRPDTIPGLNSNYWLIENHTLEKPAYVICTHDYGCLDCERRGTSIKPDFWE